MSTLIQHKFFARFLAVAAWLVFAFIVVATLAPLQYRPSVSPDAQLERFGAFATAGLLLGLAYPRRLIAYWSFLIGSAGLLEFLQRFTRDRHGQISDALAKVLGATFDILVAVMILTVLAHYRPRLTSAARQ